MSEGRLPIVVLISGSGSNLQALIDAELPVEIRAVVSNKPDAFGLERARRAGIPTAVVERIPGESREQYDARLLQTLKQYRPELVVLAGFMRILTADFVRHYEGRMLNIHPSLLPLYRGLDTHARCIAAGDREHGASVHFVIPDLDAGPVVVQARVPVRPDDTAETLAARVLEQEHRIYPKAVRWFAEGRLKLVNGEALLDGKRLTTHG